MAKVEITKRVEFDAGHRVPSHKSKCRNAHGHRYRLDVTLGGVVLGVRGQSDDGMILDFGDLKQVIVDTIVEPYDHAFLVYKGDVEMLEALCLLGTDHKTVVLPVVPTAEELVRLMADTLVKAFAPWWVDVVKVRLYETPNSVAEWIWGQDHEEEGNG